MFRIDGLIMKPSIRAFSLLELAIVMAVVALLIGSVLAGSQMIKSAEMRSYMRDIKAVSDASNQFKIQYRYLAGDMPNATQYWGVLAGCPNAVATGTPTCDGNGNGVLDNQAEQLRFWQHLANGQFIKGTYTGVVSTPLVAGTNTISLNKGLTFRIPYGKNNGAGGFFFSNVGNDINVLQLTKPSSAALGVLTATEAYSIDTKIDDGKPAYGTVLGAQQSWPSAGTPLNCTTSDVPATAAYNLGLSGTNCIIGITLNNKPVL